MKDDGLYLDHIIECIDRVRTYTRDGRDAFMADHMIQDAAIRNLQIMAESTQRLSGALKVRHPEMDWVGIAGFRTVLVHGYTDVKLARVWSVVETYLGPLDLVARQELRDLDEQQGREPEGGTL